MAHFQLFLDIEKESKNQNERYFKNTQINMEKERDKAAVKNRKIITKIEKGHLD